MKIELSISAKDLPSSGNVHVIVHVDGAQAGKTDVELDTDSPVWSKIVVVEAEPSQSVSVSIVCEEQEKSFGPVDFAIATVMEQPNHAMAKSMQDGGTIAVHMVEQNDLGMIQFQLRGKRFKNMEGFLNKSDPYFELKGLDGRTVYRSKVVENNLNPVWPTATVSIPDLTGGDFSVPVPIYIYDRDADGAKDFMGQLELSIDGFMSSKEAIDLRRSDKKTGEITVMGATIVPNDAVSQEVKQAMELVATEEAERWVAANRIQAAKQAYEKWSLAVTTCNAKAQTLQEESEQKQTMAQTATDNVTKAQEMATQLDEKATEAATLAKTKSCTGTLYLSLRGSDFKDMDGFRNVSDPYFEVYGAKGESIFSSPVMKNDLNPKWPPVDLDLANLCNGDFDMPIRVAFFDSDEGTEKKDYFGQLQLSVNGFLKADNEPQPLVKGGKATEQGTVFVDDAQLEDFVDLKQQAETLRQEALEAKRQVYETKEMLKKAQEEAEAVKIAAQEAVQAAKVAQEKADKAKTALEQAEAALE